MEAVSALDDAMVRQFGVTHIGERDMVKEGEKKPRKKRSPNRAKCPTCNVVVPWHDENCSHFKEILTELKEVGDEREARPTEERRTVNEALCTRIELARELVKASRAALLQVEAQLDELESWLTP